MKNYLLIIILGLTTTVYCQNKPPKFIELTFIVKNWEGKPVKRAIIYIETNDKKENGRYGTYKHSETIEINKEQTESKKTFKIPYSKFNNRKVKIRVHDSYATEPYYKFYKKSYESLSNKQVFNIQLERDEEAYANRKKNVIMKGNFISFIPPPYKEFFKNIYNNGFSISVYGDDLEKSISDTSIIIFSIDSTCSIVNRNIFKK